MNAKEKILALPLLVATGLLVISGCSYPGAEQDRKDYAEAQEQANQPAEPTQAPEPAETTEPVETTPAPEPSDRGGDESSGSSLPSLPALPSDGGGDDEPAPDVEAITLTPEKGTLYLNAIQGFSPELETWAIDLDTGWVEYRRYSCLGTTQGVGVGTIAPREGADAGGYEIVWEGENPGRPGYSASLDQRATVTERTLETGSEMATTHYDIELERFGGMCKDAGEMVAGFVL